jgi:hypothetical protein
LNYLNNNNCEFEYGEFDFGGEQSKEKFGYKGEGEGITIRGIG